MVPPSAAEVYNLSQMLCWRSKRKDGLRMPQIDFNADIGESFAGYKMGYDDDVIRFITSANIATGFHAGDPDWMAKTVRLAESHGVQLGAHPAYPDLAGFGRRDMALTPDEIRNAVTYQVGALCAFASSGKLQHVKPHGALYNKAAVDADVAAAVVSAVMKFDPDMIHVVLAGSLWEEVARNEGARVARECFADRAVEPDGTLVSRSKPGSVLHDVDEVANRSLKMAVERKVTAVDGSEIEFDADTLCLHGDTPGAVEMARAVRERFAAAAVDVRPMCDILASADR